jgi:hypothetical protein
MLAICGEVWYYNSVKRKGNKKILKEKKIKKPLDKCF